MDLTNKQLNRKLVNHISGLRLQQCRHFMLFSIYGTVQRTCVGFVLFRPSRKFKNTNLHLILNYFSAIIQSVSAASEYVRMLGSRVWFDTHLLVISADNQMLQM